MSNIDIYKKEIAALRDKTQRYSASVMKHEQTVSTQREVGHMVCESPHWSILSHDILLHLWCLLYYKFVYNFFLMFKKIVILVFFIGVAYIFC